MFDPQLSATQISHYYCSINIFSIFLLLNPVVLSLSKSGDAGKNLQSLVALKSSYSVYFSKSQEILHLLINKSHFVVNFILIIISEYWILSFKAMAQTENKKQSSAKQPGSNPLFPCSAHITVLLLQATAIISLPVGFQGHSLYSWFTCSPSSPTVVSFFSQQVSKRGKQTDTITQLSLFQKV